MRRSPASSRPTRAWMRWFQSAVASTSGNGGDQPLEALVGREREQVSELQPGAKHPEAGLHHAEQAERAEADPVRRDEHAERPRVERRGDVVEEAGLVGHRCRYFMLRFLSGGLCPRGPPTRFRLR